MPYFKGMYFDKSKKIYRARMYVFRKGWNLTLVDIGRFATREEAAIAADAASRKYRSSPALAVNFPRRASLSKEGHLIKVGMQLSERRAQGGESSTE